MTLKDVSATALRAEIRDVITPTRRQLRNSITSQVQAMERSSRLWLKLITYINSLSSE